MKEHCTCKKSAPWENNVCGYCQKLYIPQDQIQQTIIEDLGECWNLFLRLTKTGNKEIHPQDKQDFLKSIHDAQRIMQAQLYRKSLLSDSEKIKHYE